MKKIKFSLQLIGLFFIMLGCSNEDTQETLSEINLSKVNLSQLEYSNRFVSMINATKTLSRNIIDKYSDHEFKRDAISIEEAILEEESEIVETVLNEFPEFTYQPNPDEVENITILIQGDNINNEIDASDFSLTEKTFLKDLYDLVDNEDANGVQNIISTFKNNIENNSFSPEELNRAEYLVNTFDLIYQEYSTDSIAERGWFSSILKGALVGAIVGAVKGFVSGCITGTFLGFNPGSVAVGCMGGMVEGAVTGAVAAGIGTAIIES